jgi:MFS family permease
VREFSPWATNLDPVAAAMLERNGWIPPDADGYPTGDDTLDARAAGVVAPPTASWRSRRWAIVAALSVTETVSWGVLYYAFAVFLVPMEADLGLSAAELTGAFSLGLLVSGVAGIAVGRHLDRHSPRGLMTAGSVVGVGLVILWSQVEGVVAFYLLWVAIGLAMAAVLYEPAFTVLAKHFPVVTERRRALTALTLVAALSSFIFLPLSQALIDAFGWRDALLVLAGVLAVITVPLHALVLRPATNASAEAHADADATTPSVPASRALRSRGFWLLSGAFCLGTVTGFGTVVYGVVYLLEEGHDPAFAAFAVGLVGISQIPGRLLFVLLAGRLTPPRAMAVVFGFIAAGIGLLAAAPSTAPALVAFVLLGIGNGMTTLARATVLADVYGARDYGTIAGVAAGLTTGARAIGPVTAAVMAAALGSTPMLAAFGGVSAIAAVLAHRGIAEAPGEVSVPQAAL